MEWILKTFTLGGGGIVALIFVLILVNFLFAMFRHGGFRGALYGATIERELGSVTGTTKRMVQLKFTVHQLSREGQDRLVGLEAIAKSITSYKTLPVALTRADARRLARMLDRAAGD